MTRPDNDDEAAAVRDAYARGFYDGQCAAVRAVARHLESLAPGSADEAIVDLAVRIRTTPLGEP